MEPLVTLIRCLVRSDSYIEYESEQFEKTSPCPRETSDQDSRNQTQGAIINGSSRTGGLTRLNPRASGKNEMKEYTKAPEKEKKEKEENRRLVGRLNPIRKKPIKKQ